LVVALACLCAAILTSCNTGKGVTDESSQHAALRVLNLVFNAGGPINVMLDSDTVVSGLAFEGQTSYQQIGIGVKTIQPTITGVAGVAAGTTSVFVLVPAGNVQIRITTTSSKEIIFDSLPQAIAQRALIRGVIYARGSGRLVNLALLNIDNVGTGSIVNNL